MKVKLRTLNITTLVFTALTFLIHDAGYGQSDNGKAEGSRFTIGIGAGYAKSFGTSAEGGLLFSIEPAYRVSNVMRVGLRFQRAGLIRGIEGVAYDHYVRSPITSWLATLSLRPSKEMKVRPVAGIGIGFYDLDDIGTETNGSTFSYDLSSTEFGFAMRGGVELSRFSLSVEYNFIPAVSTIMEVGSDLYLDVETKSSYAAITLGYSIGFGRGRSQNK